MNLKKVVNITLVGKYVGLKDAYLSVIEALKHAGYAEDAKVNLNILDAENITESNIADKLKESDGVIIPGGFGDRGIQGMIDTVKYVREHDVPFLGVCLGMQVASIEYARNVLGYKDANSTEFDPHTKHNVIDLMPDQGDVNDVGGTQRLGSYPCILKVGTISFKAYGEKKIYERHRHRYEFNNEYRKKMKDKGLVFSGTSPDNRLVEVIELQNKKFFAATQYHPEFLSRPNKPEGIFKAFIAAATKNHDYKLNVKK